MTRACVSSTATCSYWSIPESALWSARALRCRTDRFDDKAASYCSCTNATKYPNVLAGFRSELCSRDQLSNEETKVTFLREGNSERSTVNEKNKDQHRGTCTQETPTHGEPVEHLKLHFSPTLAALIGGRFAGEWAVNDASARLSTRFLHLAFSRILVTFTDFNEKFPCLSIVYIQTFSSTHLNEYVFVSLSTTILNLFRFKISFIFFYLYYHPKIHELEWFRDCVTAPSDRWIFDKRLTEIRLIEALCSRRGSLSMLPFPDRFFKYTYLSCFDSQNNDFINGDRIWRRGSNLFILLRNGFARLFSINRLIEI